MYKTNISSIQMEYLDYYLMFDRVYISPDGNPSIDEVDPLLEQDYIYTKINDVIMVSVMDTKSIVERIFYKIDKNYEMQLLTIDESSVILEILDRMPL